MLSIVFERSNACLAGWLDGRDEKLATLEVGRWLRLTLEQVSEQSRACPPTSTGRSCRDRWSLASAGLQGEKAAGAPTQQPPVKHDSAVRASMAARFGCAGGPGLEC